jgi:hypothetical protein
MLLIKNKWNVKPILLSVAKPFVEKYHYAHGASKIAVSCFGLYYNEDKKNLHGVSWWMPPPFGASKSVSPNNPNGVLSLHRFCLVDDRPENAGSFLISKSIKMLCKKRWSTLVTYADIALKHNGGLYKASNWLYSGVTKKNPLFWDKKNNKMTSRKKGSITYNIKQMIEMGFEHKGNFAKHKFIYPLFNRNKYNLIQKELFFTKKGNIINAK